MAAPVEMYQRERLQMEQVAQYPDIPLEVRSWFDLHNWKIYAYQQPAGTRLIFAAAGDNLRYPMEIQVGHFNGKRLTENRFCEVSLQDPRDGKEGDRLRATHRYLVLATINGLNLSLTDIVTPRGNHRWLQIVGQPKEHHWGSTETRTLKIDPTGTKWEEAFLGSTSIITEVRATIPIPGME